MNTLTNTNEIIGDDIAIEENFAALQAQRAKVEAVANGTLIQIFSELTQYIVRLEQRIATLERVKPPEPGDLVKAVEAVLVQSTWFSDLVKTNVQDEIADIDLEQMVEHKVSKHIDDEMNLDDKVETIVRGMDLDDKVETIVRGMDLDEVLEKSIDNYDFEKLFRNATIRLEF